MNCPTRGARGGNIQGKMGFPDNGGALPFAYITLIRGLLPTGPARHL